MPSPSDDKKVPLVYFLTSTTQLSGVYLWNNGTESYVQIASLNMSNSSLTLTSGGKRRHILTTTRNDSGVEDELFFSTDIYLDAKDVLHIPNIDGLITEASHADSADSANSADAASSADRASKDINGKDIVA